MSLTRVGNESSSEVELEHLRAAKAIVDAAICFQETLGLDSISPERKQKLIQAVLEDPSFTEYLFQESFYHQV